MRTQYNVRLSTNTEGHGIDVEAKSFAHAIQRALGVSRFEVIEKESYRVTARLFFGMNKAFHADYIVLKLP